MAAIVGNRSAIETYEAWCSRKPIIADDVNTQGRYHYAVEGGYTHGATSTRKKERLAIGFTFPWKGEVVEVTSFNDEGAAICCSRTPTTHTTCNRCGRVDSTSEGKILHRYTVTPELIQAERAERKKLCAKA